MLWDHRCVLADVDDDRGFLAKTTLLSRLLGTVREERVKEALTSLDRHGVAGRAGLRASVGANL